MPSKPELKAQFPTLEQRANRYIPILTGLTSGVVYILAALAVLQAWNVGAFAWFASDLGRRMTGNALSIGMVLDHRACAVGNFGQRDRAIP